MDLLGQLVESLSLSLLLLLAVCEWLSGSVLCCVSSVIYQVYREERQRERGREGETTPVAGRQQLPASWLSVLTPHLTSMGTEQPPLLSSSVGTRGQIFIFSPPLALLLFGLSSSGHRPWTEQDMTGQDSLGSETSAGDFGSEDRTLGSEMAQLAQSASQAVSQTAVQLSSQSGSQMVS